MSQSPFLDRSGWTPEPLDLWEPLLVTKEEIDAEKAPRNPLNVCVIQDHGNDAQCA